MVVAETVDYLSAEKRRSDGVARVDPTVGPSDEAFAETQSGSS
jgi:hypothetical protein